MDNNEEKVVETNDAEVENKVPDSLTTIEEKDANVSDSTVVTEAKEEVKEENTVIIDEQNNKEQRIEMIDQKQKDILNMINPTQQTTEFHLINKNNLPEKKNRYEGYEYKPPSGFKIFLLVIFMIFVIVLVMFMPEINTYVKKYLGKDDTNVSKEITTGRLICKTTDSNNVFNYKYNYVFSYTDNKLDLLTYTNTTIGSEKEDSELLGVRYKECQTLADHATGIEGVTVTCKEEENSVIETQIIDYNKYNRDQMISAFVESGGNYPEFSAGEDINFISKKMVASNYLCEKTK